MYVHLYTEVVRDILLKLKQIVLGTLMLWWYYLVHFRWEALARIC